MKEVPSSELGNLVLQTPFAERPPVKFIQSFQLQESMESLYNAAVDLSISDSASTLCRFPPKVRLPVLSKLREFLPTN